MDAVSEYTFREYWARQQVSMAQMACYRLEFTYPAVGLPVNVLSAPLGRLEWLRGIQCTDAAKHPDRVYTIRWLYWSEGGVAFTGDVVPDTETD